MFKENTLYQFKNLESEELFKNLYAMTNLNFYIAKKLRECGGVFSVKLHNGINKNEWYIYIDGKKLVDDYHTFYLTDEESRYFVEVEEELDHFEENTLYQFKNADMIEAFKFRMAPNKLIADRILYLGGIFSVSKHSNNSFDIIIDGVQLDFSDLKDREELIFVISNEEARYFKKFDSYSKKQITDAVTKAIESFDFSVVDITTQSDIAKIVVEQTLKNLA